MLDPRHWKFGKIEVVTGDFAISASQLPEVQHIESIYEFTFFLKQWLGDAGYRNSVIAIEREVTQSRAAPLLGRGLGRENDETIVAGLQSAFRARKLHVLRNIGRFAPKLTTGAGRAWTFPEAQIIQRDRMLPMKEFADFFRVTEARNVSNTLTRWLKDPIPRRTVENLHDELFGSSTERYEGVMDDMADERIVKDLLSAWSDGELYLLRRKLEGGNSDEEEGAPVQQAAAKRGASEVKTWIEVVLKDQYDKPMAGAKYRLRITDGSLREGMLNAEGSVRVNGIDPGMCEVMFPEFDAKTWQPA
jgi:hypothetical protein